MKANELGQALAKVDRSVIDRHRQPSLLVKPGAFHDVKPSAEVAGHLFETKSNSHPDVTETR